MLACILFASPFLSLALVGLVFETRRALAAIRRGR
jgi:hypothetical protein